MRACVLHSPRLIGLLGINCNQAQNFDRHLIMLSSMANICVMPIALMHFSNNTASNQPILSHPPAAPRGAKDKLAAIAL